MTATPTDYPTPSNALGGQKVRIAGIDGMKTVAILAVVLLHSPIELPAIAPFLPDTGAIITNFCRFAVPFFFIASGYFIRRAFQPGTTVEAVIFPRLRRLALIFLVWSIVFAVIPADWNSHLKNEGLIGTLRFQLMETLTLAQTSPHLLWLRGTGSHLWFLSALITSAAIVGLLVRGRQEKLILPLGALLFVWSVLGGAYAETALGLPTFGIGCWSPLYSTVFVGLGWYLGSHAICPWTAKTAYLLLGLGAILHQVEPYVAWRVWDVRYDFAGGGFFSSVVFGLGAFLVAWCHPHPKVPPIVIKMGTYTLGIYLLHPLLVGSCHGIVRRIWEPLCYLNFAIAFVLTSLIIYFLAKHKTLRSFVQ